MQRDFYLNLADSGLRMPIGTDLTLKEHDDHEAILLDGPRLGRVSIQAARRFHTPLALPLMDLRLEKEFLVGLLGHSGVDHESWLFSEGEPGDAHLRKVREALATVRPTKRMTAACEAIRTVAAEAPELVPAGMGIGPFSLLVKLLPDPITQIYLATMDPDEEEAECVRNGLEIASEVILHYIGMQIEAGAKIVCICEPAANLVYLSPNQLSADPGLFDRMVIDYNLRIAELLQSRGVDLLLHDCGELTDEMVTAFNKLDPAILSLGSSRVLWEDAARVSKRTVLFGNIPSKGFVLDEKGFREEDIAHRARELTEKMREVGHPFILGSECDVLCVHGAEDKIHRKVNAMLDQEESRDKKAE